MASLPVSGSPLPNTMVASQASRLPSACTSIVSITSNTSRALVMWISSDLDTHAVPLGQCGEALEVVRIERRSRLTRPGRDARFGEELLEASRCDQDQRTSRVDGRVGKAVHDLARQKDEVAASDEVLLLADRYLKDSVEQVERFVLFGVDMRRRAAAGRDGCLEQRERAAGRLGGRLEGVRVAGDPGRGPCTGPDVIDRHGSPFLTETLLICENSAYTNFMGAHTEP